MDNCERIARLDNQQETLEKKQVENRGDIRQLFNRADDNRGRIESVEKDIEKILEIQADIQKDIRGISRRMNRCFLYKIGGAVMIGLAFMIVRWVLFR